MKIKICLILALSAVMFIAGGCEEYDVHSNEGLGDMQTSVAFETEIAEVTTIGTIGATHDVSAETKTSETSVEYSTGKTTSKRRDGIYEYRGLTFEGVYFTDSLSSEEIFYVDTNSLDKEPGLSLYKAAVDIATLFYCNDTKGVNKYFDNDEDYNFAIDFGDMSEASEPSQSDEPRPLTPYNIIAYDDGFIFIFLHWSANSNESPDEISMDIFLNDDGEWKIHFVSYS